MVDDHGFICQEVLKNPDVYSGIKAEYKKKLIDLYFDIVVSAEDASKIFELAWKTCFTCSPDLVNVLFDVGNLYVKMARMLSSN